MDTYNPFNIVPFQIAFLKIITYVYLKRMPFHLIKITRDSNSKTIVNVLIKNNYKTHNP